MYKLDFYTGEPTVGSPQNSPPDVMSEQEIVNNANMMYATSPQQRIQGMGYQQPMYNTGYGYNDTSGFGNFMNPPQQPQYGAYGGYQGYAGNPAFYYMQQNQYGNMGYGQPTYNPTFNDYTYVVQPYNTGSNALLPADVEERCNELQIKMMEEQEAAYQKRMEQQRSFYSNLGYGNGINYYGVPYVNQSYYDVNITNKYRKIAQDMAQEAINARTKLNRQLSGLCQNYLYGSVDEERLDSLYSPHTITIPAAEIRQNYDQSRFDNLVEIDTSAAYRQHHAEVSARYHKYIDEDADMNTFFEQLGPMMFDEALATEAKRRRDLSQLGDTDAYKVFMRSKIRQKLGIQQEQRGFTLPSMQQGENIPMGRSFPTLNESARLLDDGTLSITAPNWLKNQTVVVKNEKENEYDFNQRRFQQSIYRDMAPPTAPPPNPGGENNG